MILTLEIAGGVVIGLVAHSWISQTCREWERKLMDRRIEKVKEVIARGMPLTPEAE
jgi:hypothetical protein